jgi:hypothetical protein
LQSHRPHSRRPLSLPSSRRRVPAPFRGSVGCDQSPVNECTTSGTVSVPVYCRRGGSCYRRRRCRIRGVLECDGMRAHGRGNDAKLKGRRVGISLSLSPFLSVCWFIVVFGKGVWIIQGACHIFPEMEKLDFLQYWGLFPPNYFLGVLNSHENHTSSAGTTRFRLNVPSKEVVHPRFLLEPSINTLEYDVMTSFFDMNPPTNVRPNKRIGLVGWIPPSKLTPESVAYR